MGKRESDSIQRGRERQRVLIAVLVVFFGFLMARMFTLQVLRHETYDAYALDNQLQRERFVAPRGFVLDRTGAVLVDNVLHFEVSIPWRDRRDVSDALNTLCHYLPIDSVRVLERFERWRGRYGHAAFPIIPDADKFVISFIRENAEKFPNIRVQSRAQRRYRDGKIGAQLLGYVGEVGDRELNSEGPSTYHAGDMIGRSAVERYAERWLRGVDGQRVHEVNATGRVLGEVVELSTPPEPGRDVTLTVDARLQSFLESLLAQHGPSSAVVMNAEDGSVIAAASYPAYDPNVFARGITQDELDELVNDETKPLFNRIHQARYPPASTFKMVSAWAILKNRLVDPNEILVYCTGQYQFGNRIFRCWLAGGHGSMNLHTALVESCDSYFYKCAEILNVDDLSLAARRFGFGQLTGIELPGEVSGLVPDREYYNKRFGRGRWTQGYILNNVIGQGEFLVNMVQIARMTAAIANGGHLVTPHVVASVEGEPPLEYPRNPIPELSSRHLRYIQNAMLMVVEDPDGTANWTRIPGLKVAGKTGTAQNPHGDHHALYTAYAPYDAPEIVVSVIVENAGHGGEVAAPIARDFLREYFASILPERQARSTPAASGGAQ